MSWKPEVRVVNQNTWSRNALVFETKDEAERNAFDLMMRWTAVEEHRAVEVDEPVKHIYTPEGELMEYTHRKPVTKGKRS